MCKTNTCEQICTKPLSTILKGKGAQTKIPWCAATDRKILQIISACRLTPDNLVTQLYHDPSDGASYPIFELLCRQVNCWWPANKQYAPAVHPKLIARVRALFRRLDRDDVIVLFSLPDGGRRQVYWPPYTRAWQLADWDNDLGGTVAGLGEDRRRALEKVEEGGPLPAWLDEAVGAPAPQQVEVPPPPQQHFQQQHRQAQPQTQHHLMGSTPPDPWRMSISPSTAPSDSTFWTTASSEARAREALREEALDVPFLHSPPPPPPPHVLPLHSDPRLHQPVDLAPRVSVPQPGWPSSLPTGQQLVGLSPPRPMCPAKQHGLGGGQQGEGAGTSKSARRRAAKRFWKDQSQQGVFNGTGSATGS